MSLDLEALLRRIVGEVLDERAPRIAEMAAERVRAASVEPLLPLCQILDCSPGAALQVERRRPALVGVAVQSGRRRVYRASDVRRVLGEPTRPTAPEASLAALARGREARRQGRPRGPALRSMDGGRR